MQDLRKLQEENTILKARNMWLENVAGKMIVMIGNAADVFDEYVKQLDTVQVALRETQGIYSRLHTDLTEAFNEPRQRGSAELCESEQGDAAERG